MAKTVSATVTINAVPAEVWAVLCDLGRRHTEVVQSEIYRGLVVPLIGKTIAAAHIEFNEVNQALKRRAEQDPGIT